MKRYDGIDYGFRPDSYWSTPDPLSLILRHVKGTNRRQSQGRRYGAVPCLSRDHKKRAVEVV